jgi:hypothetical protein
MVANRNIITSLTSMPPMNRTNTANRVKAGPPKVSAVGAMAPIARTIKDRGTEQMTRLVGNQIVASGIDVDSSTVKAGEYSTHENSTRIVPGIELSTGVAIANTRNTSHNAKKTAISSKKTTQSILYP